ncbi:hypothetical protein JCM11251_005001 [Rhodosporidiobolus azoricus]
MAHSRRHSSASFVGDEDFFLSKEVSHLHHLPEPVEPDEYEQKAIYKRDKAWRNFKQTHSNSTRKLDELDKTLTTEAKDLEIYERKCFYLRVQQILPDIRAYKALYADELEEVATELLRVTGPVEMAERRAWLSGRGNSRVWKTEEYTLITLRAALHRAKMRKEQLEHMDRLIEWELKHPEKAKEAREKKRKEEEEEEEVAKAAGSRSLSRSQKSTDGLETTDSKNVDGRAHMQGSTRRSISAERYEADARKKHRAYYRPRPSEPVFVHREPRLTSPNSSVSSSSTVKDKRLSFRGIFKKK